jgi:hypothetical protein
VFLWLLMSWAAVSAPTGIPGYVLVSTLLWKRLEGQQTRDQDYDFVKRQVGLGKVGTA